MKLFRFFLLIFSLFLLTACSPIYEIKTHYTVPVDDQGKACVQTCSNERKICQANCNQKQDQCLAITKQEVESSFPDLMNEYEGVFNEYEYAMQRYEREMRSWTREERRVHQDFEHYKRNCDKKTKDTHACRRSHELGDQLRRLQNQEPITPERPLQPSLAEEIQLAQKACSNDCGCIQSYDNCFVSCGGTLRYEKFCVENCK